MKFHANIAMVAFIASIAELLINPILGFEIGLNDFGWILSANLIIVYVLGFHLINMRRLNKPAIIVSLVTVSFVIGTFNILFESFAFSVTNLQETATISLHGLIKYVIISFVLYYFLRNHLNSDSQARSRRRSVVSWLPLIGISIILYVLVYFIAGFILQASLPALTDFYSDKVPSFGIIFVTQVARGAVFSLIAIYFIKLTTLPLFTRALLLGLIFSILGGIAPLMVPNQYMPLDIRIGHGFEVGISNFIYGVVICFILSPRTEVIPAVTQA